MNPSAVAAELRLEVLERLPGGEHAVWAVRDGAGSELVLKVFAKARLAQLESAAAIAGRVRSRGVPVPDRYEVGIAAGAAYTLQGRCAGAVPDRLEEAHARQLLTFWRAHRDAVPEGSDWPERAISALCRGDPALFTDHTPIRTSPRHAVDLLDEIIAVGRTAEPSTLRRTDAMHGDWHHRNLLAERDRVTAVIDWEQAGPGDARLDLVLLCYWAEAYAGTGVAPGAASRISAAVEQHVEPTARRLLSAFVALHQLWFVCALRPERIDETVARVRRGLAPHWTAGR